MQSVTVHSTTWKMWKTRGEEKANIVRLGCKKRETIYRSAFLPLEVEDLRDDALDPPNERLEIAVSYL